MQVKRLFTRPSMPFEPTHSFPRHVHRYLLAIWRGMRWTAMRVVRLTHYGVYKTFIRNEPISSEMLPPTLNKDDLKFLVIGGLLFMCVCSILYWTKVIGIHR